MSGKARQYYPVVAKYMEINLILYVTKSFPSFFKIKTDLSTLKSKWVKQSVDC